MGIILTIVLLYYVFTCVYEYYFDFFINLNIPAVMYLGRS